MLCAIVFLTKAMLMNTSNLSLGSFSSYSHKINGGDHICEFYENSSALISSLCDFVVPGITRGEGIILIATPNHTKMLISALENRSIDVAKAIAHGQLIIKDAQSSLDRFMLNGIPHSEKFKTLLDPILLDMQEKFPRVRAYGEMVDILIKKNHVEATLQLENLWNEVCAQNNISLLCGYLAETFRNKGPNLMKKICSTHNHLICDGHLHIPQ